jgi:hypothetical protein
MNIVSIALCCNEPDNGNFNGSFCSVHIGAEELLHLENKYYPAKEPKLSYHFEVTMRGSGFGADRVTGHIAVDGRDFPVIGYKGYWGNWCWDLVIMRPKVALEFINYLKSIDCFQCESGDAEFYELFNTPGALFSDAQLPALEKWGYQAP